jgi:hypothetical protein
MFEQAFKNIDDILWKEAGCAKPAKPPFSSSSTSSG